MVSRCSPALLLASRTTSGVYAKPLPTQRSSGCTIIGLDKMTPQFILIMTRRTSPIHAQPQRYKHTSGISHRKRRPSRQIMSFSYFLKIPFLSFKILVPLFLVNCLWPMGCIYKTGINMHQRMELDLPFTKPSGKS
jgi:hypothetical protein